MAKGRGYKRMKPTTKQQIDAHFGFMNDNSQ